MNVLEICTDRLISRNDLNYFRVKLCNAGMPISVADNISNDDEAPTYYFIEYRQGRFDADMKTIVDLVKGRGYNVKLARYTLSNTEVDM